MSSSCIHYSLSGDSSHLSLLESNPTLNMLESSLRGLAYSGIQNEVREFILSIIDISRAELALKYYEDGNMNLPVFRADLPEGFYKLSDFKDVAGIYHFAGHEGVDYVGSSSDLESRLNQHRTRGLNPNQSYRHPSLYPSVIRNG